MAKKNIAGAIGSVMFIMIASRLLALFSSQVYMSVFGTDSIYINNDCAISVTERDILNINGIIHQVEKVIAPKDITAASYIQQCLDEKKEGYLVCFRVIQACGLLDTLSKVRDEKYEELYRAFTKQTTSKRFTIS